MVGPGKYVDGRALTLWPGSGYANGYSILTLKPA